MDFAAERGRMVREQIEGRGIADPKLLEAFVKVPRERFVPEHIRHLTYAHRALPIGLGQTISEPYVVALALSHLPLGPDARVLEIGTGSGYQAALLAELAGHVVTVERHVPLADRARGVLDDLGYENVRVVVRDGSKGYPREGPYNAIVVAAAAPDAPDPLIEQLANGGVLVIPVGDLREGQILYAFTREGYDVRREALASVRFVPLVGRHGYKTEQEKPIIDWETGSPLP